MKLLDNEPDAAGSEVAVEIKVWALVLALQFVIQVVSVVIFNDLVYLIITLVAVCYQIIMVGVVVYGAHSRRALPLLVYLFMFAPIVPSFGAWMALVIVDLVVNAKDLSILLIELCVTIVAVLSFVINLWLAILAYRLRKVVRSEQSFEEVYEILYAKNPYIERAVEYIRSMFSDKSDSARGKLERPRENEDSENSSLLASEIDSQYGDDITE